MSGIGYLKPRRRMILATIGLLLGACQNTTTDTSAVAAEFADMPALRGKDYGKSKMRYPDYTETDSGLSVQGLQDLRTGSGPTPKTGETVVVRNLVDWDGYTIGYYGRIFEARNKTKGGSFEGDERLSNLWLDPSRLYKLLRRLYVTRWRAKGQRALDFVLRNQGLIDKTLLFDRGLIKIMPS